MTSSERELLIMVAELLLKRTQGPKDDTYIEMLIECVREEGGCDDDAEARADHR